MSERVGSKPKRIDVIEPNETCAARLARLRSTGWAGAGIAMPPIFLVDDTRASGALRPVLPDKTPGTLTIHALRPTPWLPHAPARRCARRRADVPFDRITS